MIGFGTIISDGRTYLSALERPYESFQRFIRMIVSFLSAAIVADAVLLLPISSLQRSPECVTAMSLCDDFGSPRNVERHSNNYFL
jgi:hypothetical protein